MPIQKITETELSSSPSPDTHFLVTQPETDEAGKLVESLRRIGADNIANMLKEKFGLGDTAKEIASLKEDIGSFTVLSKNLLDEKSFIKDFGIYANGTTGSLVGTYLSPLINVDGLADITVTLNGNTSVNAIRRCFYSSQTGDVVGIVTSDLYPNKSTTFKVPSGARYFRFSMPESYYNECISNGMMVEPGKSYTGYAKYNTVVEVSVYSKGTKKYTNIYVGQNKQFKTIRSAIEFIADSVGRSAASKSNYYNRYNIFIDGGTYDILGEFSFEELSASTFEGIYIPDYVNIYGIGTVVLTGDWDNYKNKFSDDESYYSFVISRHVVCPINTHKNCIFKNITIKTHNMRYCLHDEDAGVFYDSEQLFENCNFIAEEADSNVRANIYATPVGIGISNRKITFKNCNFIGKTQAKQSFFFHSHASADMPSSIELEKCCFSCGTNGHSIFCTSYGEQTNNKVAITDCSLKDIAHTKADNYTGNCDFTFVGGGNTDFMYSFDANDTNRLLFDCVMCKNNFSSVIPKGKPVRLHSYNTIMPFTTSSEKSSQFYGIAVEDIPANGYGLIKTHGFIKLSDTSLQSANVGDLIGIANKDLGVVESGYSFARCVFADWLLIN